MTERDTDGLIESLQGRKSVYHILEFGPMVAVKGRHVDDFTFRDGAYNYGYRVGMVIPSINMILYVPEEWEGVTHD